ncbi:MAG: hypothetical protein NXI01_07490 [Gammaproteobacteria bacterium]|nr:hypothetical protein [Gammaproteobacteria bacterium]
MNKKMTIIAFLLASQIGGQAYATRTAADAAVAAEIEVEAARGTAPVSNIDLAAAMAATRMSNAAWLRLGPDGCLGGASGCLYDDTRSSLAAWADALSATKYATNLGFEIDEILGAHAVRAYRVDRPVGTPSVAGPTMSLAATSAAAAVNCSMYTSDGDGVPVYATITDDSSTVRRVRAAPPTLTPGTSVAYAPASIYARGVSAAAPNFASTTPFFVLCAASSGDGNPTPLAATDMGFTWN